MKYATQYSLPILCLLYSVTINTMSMNDRNVRPIERNYRCDIHCVNDCCDAAAVCCIRMACFPCSLLLLANPESNIYSDNLIKKMEEKKKFVDLAASLGFHEDPAKQRKHIDNPWDLHPDRFIRMNADATNPTGN